MDELNLSEEREKEIDEAFKIAFRGKSGKAVLEYLRTLTLNSALMPGCTPDQVMHREGARWLMGIILERTNRGRNPHEYKHSARRDDDGRGRRVSEYFDRSDD
tara:strand:+ start:3263 stop:3571 length:309 start_codon:yes stop_codon:yes gene_type:complete